MTIEATITSVSRAQFSFESDAVPQVERLLGIHRTIGGSGRGRRRNLEILNKSAVVLTCSFWEAFVEDLAAEAINHLAEFAEKPEDLPIDLRKNVAKHVVRGKHELAPWELAGDGWREWLRQAASRLSQEADQTLSSPSSRKVDEFFKNETGITNLMGSWKWPGMAPDRAQVKLDDFVSLRNAIAHRGGPQADSVKKSDAEDGLQLIKQVASKSLEYVDCQLEMLVGRRLIPAPVAITLPSSPA